MRVIPSLTIPLLLCLATDARAQVASTAAGGEAGGEGQVSWSIGQPFFQTVEGPNGATTVGVQQPYVFLTTGINEAPDIELQLAVAPNPTRSSVRLIVDITKYEQLDYELLGVNGKLLRSARITSSDTPVDMDGLGSGTYLLHLHMDGRTLRTIQIIKTN